MINNYLKEIKPPSILLVLYPKELRDVTLRYMGSSNQRFIEMPLTFIEKNGTIYIDYKNKENNNGSDFED